HTRFSRDWSSDVCSSDLGKWRETMMRDDAASRRLMRRVNGGAALLIALAIFALDVLTPLQGAVAVLYTSVVLLASRIHSRVDIEIGRAACRDSAWAARRA